MGLAFADQRNFDKAIKYYKKALETPGYDRPSRAWKNMGNAFARNRNSKKAIECYQKAKAEYEKAGDTTNVAVMDFRIAAIKVPEEERSSKDREVVDADPQAITTEPEENTPEQRMLAKLTGAETTAYQKYLSSFKEEKGVGDEVGPTDVLAVLKGWGSATPLLPSNTSGCRGGGYFLKWKGKGFVIDPGFDFWRNFTETGFHFKEIQAVAVSHNHPDHNHDLRAMETLRYELRKLDESINYDLFWDEDTADAKKMEFDPSVHQRQPAAVRFDLSRQEGHFEDALRPPNLPFAIKYFRAKHSPELHQPVCLRITCDEGSKAPFTLGYSADTEFSESLCRDDQLGGCDILVAHVSQPTIKELQDLNILKQGHLGYRGTERLIKGCKPKLTVVCEFWSGLEDLRIDLIQGLRNNCGTDAIIPGGLGLFINPRELTIRCTACGGWTHYSKVSVGAPDRSFGGLQYLCENCRL
jgi:ribonuclease BN (tRNA processing enzyme)